MTTGEISCPVTTGKDSQPRDNRRDFLSRDNCIAGSILWINEEEEEEEGGWGWVVGISPPDLLYHPPISGQRKYRQHTA